jgi:catechol 2,3-dioxygenase-like lactoylglutathione lyase family enzyme
MNKQILGIHHITAIAGDPQTNIDFHTNVLGFRLVKLTVNFDDPATYHLYYGDGVGHPGTILTFFPWPDAPKGRLGTGQVTDTAFVIPETGIDFRASRLTERRIAFLGDHSTVSMSRSSPSPIPMDWRSSWSARRQHETIELISLDRFRSNSPFGNSIARRCLRLTLLKLPQCCGLTISPSRRSIRANREPLRKELRATRSVHRQYYDVDLFAAQLNT